MTAKNQPLRICLLSYRSNPHCGGQGVYVKNLSKALVGLGHRVDVVSGPPYPDLNPGVGLVRLPSLDLYNPDDLFRIPSLWELSDPINLLEWMGVATMGFSEIQTFGMRAQRYLKTRFRRYDIVHDNQSLSYGIWRIKRKLPLVATIHHPITVDRDIDIRSETLLWKKIKHLRWYFFLSMQKRVSRTLPHVITVSTCARNDISREFGIPEQRFSIIPNGIDTDRFYPLPGVERRKNRLIVTNSADMPLKGLNYLLMSVAEIASRQPIRLVVVGAPKKNSAIVRQLQELGIGKYVTFTGRISDAEFVRQYARATAAVIPSIYEGFGLPAGEAMACGVPVISTTGGALPEVVGDAGILVPPANTKALTKAILEVINQPGLAEKLSEAGYNRVRNHLTWEAAARKTVDVYHRVMCDYHSI